MNHHLFKPVIAGMLACCFLTATGQAVEVGDTAPALHIDRWVQGDAIDLKESHGRDIIVVEFWATWCAPCRTSIPHLTELQAQFAKQGVRIMGVTDEKVATVKPFVRRMGKQMQYTVAIDEDQKTYANYMEAFGINGIPHAFIINKEGKLVWQGHPMNGLEAALEAILDGTYDLAAARQAARGNQLIPRYLGLITAESDDPKAKVIGREILEHHDSDWEFLNNFAWHILTDEQVRHRDYDLAKAAAHQAFELTQGKTSDVNDTYARALFEAGQVQEAVIMQQKAIAANEDPAEDAGLKKTLARYQSKLAQP